MAKYLLLITILVGCLMTFVSANDETLKEIAVSEVKMKEIELNLLEKAIKFLWKSGQSSYTHVWPDMKFGWEIIVGSFIGFLGAAFGSVGGVGGGGFFVPMLTLVIGFDSKSSAAISKCMIMGTAASTVYYNLKQRHPTLDMPIVDYDLALLFQPVLVLGISIGVAFNVVLADWMITVLLIILFLFTSIKAFFKGVDAWKKESIAKKEVAQRLLSHGDNNNDYNVLSSVPNKREVSIMKEVNWPIVAILLAVWFAILGLEVTQKYTSTCTIAYWTINLLQIPIALGASGYEAYMLYHGKRVIASRGDCARPWKIQQLIICMTVGVCAGIVGGLLGVGGGSILGPLFLELGVPPQVSSATATFAMMFSSSMSVVEYYLLKRFPVPYAAYFVIVATFSALIGQVLVKKLIAILGRASLIIFVFSFTVFVSAFSLGGVGISNMVYKIQHNEYMGFDSLCTYDV